MLLEDKSQDSDGSIIIPEELEEMLASSLKQNEEGAKIPEDELINQIDGISLSKREANAINVNCHWVDDLLKHEGSASSKTTLFLKDANLMSPLLISDSYYKRVSSQVSTPKREQYNNVLYRASRNRDIGMLKTKRTKLVHTVPLLTKQKA